MTPRETTTAALLTPLAPGAIAVIGIAGPRTIEILRNLLAAPHGDAAVELVDRRPTLCRIVEDGRTLDDAVVVRLSSSDGESAELNTHGGVRIVQRVLWLLERQGARLIGGVEFRESLSQDNRTQLDADHALLSSRSRRLTEWLLRQRTLLPQYPDQSCSEDSASWEQFKGARPAVGIALVAGIEIAIVGPPNAGKSTLANRFIGSDAVITSTVAGTTRDWVSRTAVINGWPVTLTDTAGIRDTRCAIETEAIRRGRSRAREADLVIVLLDGALPLEDQDRDSRRMIATVHAGQPCVIVRNKMDLVGGCRNGMDENACLVSAVNGEGMGALESRIATILGFDLLEDDLPAAFLQRQLDQISQRVRRKATRP